MVFVIQLNGYERSGKGFITALTFMTLVCVASSARLYLNKINCVNHIAIVRTRLFGYYRRQLTASQANEEKRWLVSRNDALKDHMSCDRLNIKLKIQPVMKISDYAVSYPFPDRSIPMLTELTTPLLRFEDSIKHSLESDGITITSGGWNTPASCNVREIVGIVIPFRDRHSNLMTFLSYMHRFLHRQNRHYFIFIAEQSNNEPFNRAKLLNAAVAEIIRDYPQIACLIFHDVDKLPFHGLNTYACEYHPKQLAAMKHYYEIDKMEEYYEFFFGGVTAFSKWHLLRMNGGSNSFYGWGGEDDDFMARALLAGLQPIFQSKYLGRMYVQNHHNDTLMLKERYKMLYMNKVLRRMRHDGLHEVKYTRKYDIKRPLYTVYGLDV